MNRSRCELDASPALNLARKTSLIVLRMHKSFSLHCSGRDPAAREMAPFISTVPNSNSRYSQSAGQQTQNLEGIQLNKLPQTSSGYNVEQQQPSGRGPLDANPYLAGLLDGIAAANAKYTGE